MFTKKSEGICILFAEIKRILLNNCLFPILLTFLYLVGIYQKTELQTISSLTRIQLIIVTDNCSNDKYFDKMSEQFWHKIVSNEDIEQAKSAYTDAFQYAILVSAKGQLISKGNFCDFKSTKNLTNILSTLLP